MINAVMSSSIMKVNPSGRGERTGKEKRGKERGRKWKGTGM